jgi:hypothetical protein
MAKHKSVQELMEERNPLKNRRPIGPVDIYSQQPEQADESKTTTTTQELPTPSTKKSTTTQGDLIPFSTYLPKHIVKQLRLRSVVNDGRNYEIVRDALEQYFERNPIEN